MGIIDFDLCGLGHFLFDLAVLLHALRLSALRSQRPDHFWNMRETFFEHYERERLLPECYRRYLMTFYAMRYVARVNKEFSAISWQANRRRAGGHNVLRNVVTWLQSNYLEDKW